MITIIINIAVIMFSKNKMNDKHKFGSGRNILTFSNPNYSVNASSGSSKTNNGSEKKSALWKRIKYDKNQVCIFRYVLIINIIYNSW